jgi:hypothetical protein
MNSIRACLLSFLAVSLVGCGGGADTKGTADGGGNAPSVSGLQPSQAFLGRAVDIQISGSDTHWDATTTVDFGMGITVNKITVASPTALIANIAVANTAPAGPRTITVKQGSTNETFNMGFTIGSPMKVVVLGTVAQGSLLNLDITNLDVTDPFDDTSYSTYYFPNLNFTAPTGLSIEVTAATSTSIQAQVTVDVTTTPGPVDLTLASGDPSGTPETFFLPAAFTIAARTATAFTANAVIDITQPDATSLYKVTPTGANHALIFNAGASTPTNPLAQPYPYLALLDNTGTFANGYLNAGQALTYLTTDTSPLYLIAGDQGGFTGFNVTIGYNDVALTMQAGGEGNDTTNDTSAGAVVLSAPPVLVAGASLSSATDLDWYAVTVAAGKAIHATTVPGDQYTNTTLQFFNSDGTTVLDSPSNLTDPTKPVDNGYQEDAISDVVTTAGTYYIVVGYSTSYGPYDETNTHYDLVVTLQ